MLASPVKPLATAPTEKVTENSGLPILTLTLHVTHVTINSNNSSCYCSLKRQKIMLSNGILEELRDWWISKWKLVKKVIKKIQTGRNSQYGVRGSLPFSQIRIFYFILLIIKHGAMKLIENKLFLKTHCP